MVRRVVGRVSSGCLGLLPGARAVAGFVVGAAIVALGTGIAAPERLLSRAYAQDPESCVQNDEGLLVDEERDAAGAQPTVGVQSYVRVVDGADCQRIRAVFMRGPGGAGVEFGYLIGWWGPSPCAGVDHNHFYVHPTLFAVGFDTDGDYFCQFWENRHPNEATYDYFEVSDGNKNGVWEAFWNGSEQLPLSLPMDFSDGAASVSMERRIPNDSGYARFNYISEWHYQGNGWSNTDDLRPRYNLDPDYHIENPNEHTSKMVHD